MDYKKLYFGLADSRNEASSDPEDFVRSYVNINNIVEDVVSGRRTLVFGPKGTGKSALAYYVVATAQEHRQISKVRDASTLPLAEIPNLQTGQPQGVDRTVTAWKFILLCNYLELLLEDQGCLVPNDKEVRRVTRILRDFGFMGDTSGRALLKVATTTVSIPIPKIGTVYKKESKSSLNIFSLLPYLEEWAAGARSGNRHILFLDGLDSIFLNDSRYDESLASLVQAAYSVNQQLHETGATGSVVLLMRNDVFSRISLRVPDSQKMRDDFGVELDWRILSGAAGENAPLMKLVNMKASKDAGRDIRVLEYFPQHIAVGRNSRHIPRMQYFLNLTRHTPRDLLRLFDEIRKVEASGNFPASAPRLHKSVIREGVLQYSTRYFVNAIRNEFAGFDGGPEAAQVGLAALQAIGRQDFTRTNFVERLDQSALPSGITADHLLRLFFFAGALGNLVGVKDSHLRFFHRRDDAEIYLKGRLILHGALCHAWNIPFSI